MSVDMRYANAYMMIWETDKVMIEIELIYYFYVSHLVYEFTVCD